MITESEFQDSKIQSINYTRVNKLNNIITKISNNNNSCSTKKNQNTTNDYLLRSEMTKSNTNTNTNINTLSNNCINQFSINNFSIKDSKDKEKGLLYKNIKNEIDKNNNNLQKVLPKKKDDNNEINNNPDNNNKENPKGKFNEKQELDLEILSSWSLPKGLQLHINQFGLSNSIRNQNDGIVFFGFQTEEELNNNPYIDYLLGPKDQEYDEHFIGKHFQIRYDNTSQKYFIKDLGCGFGTFIKLIDELKIKENMLINMGESYIVFSFGDGEKKSEIIIKLFTGDEQISTFKFNSENQNCILIGRDSSLCDITVEDKMLSRVHCCLFYKNEEWYIRDGNLEGKSSTNNTWVYSAEENEIYDQMIFKTNHNLFKCICK